MEVNLVPMASPLDLDSDLNDLMEREWAWEPLGPRPESESV